MARPFALFLHDFRDGATHAELTDGLDQLIAAVQATHKSGSLTLTIKITPASRNGMDKVLVTDDVKLKLPELGRSEDMFYLTEDGELSRRHPRQQDLPLAAAPAAAPLPVRDAQG